MYFIWPLEGSCAPRVFLPPHRRNNKPYYGASGGNRQRLNKVVTRLEINSITGPMLPFHCLVDTEDLKSVLI
ncbi:hypothetical protein J4Q44_G00307730 [Coregonus suidteri]|uniref:Uncharacterized protein n=1 Tax=Coregonus suidteri TaxID=861788 RepID=A0AAN8KWL0_9TELE